LSGISGSSYDSSHEILVGGNEVLVAYGSFGSSLIITDPVLFPRTRVLQWGRGPEEEK
jgi:hypothetical protein